MISGDALHCWVCSSDANAHCADPFNTTSKRQYLVTDCDRDRAHSAYLKSAVCRKYKHKREYHICRKDLRKEQRYAYWTLWSSGYEWRYRKIVQEPHKFTHSQVGAYVREGPWPLPRVFPVHLNRSPIVYNDEYPFLLDFARLHLATVVEVSLLFWPHMIYHRAAFCPSPWAYTVCPNHPNGQSFINATKSSRSWFVWIFPISPTLTGPKIPDSLFLPILTDVLYFPLSSLFWLFWSVSWTWMLSGLQRGTSACSYSCPYVHGHFILLL